MIKMINSSIMYSLLNLSYEVYKLDDVNNYSDFTNWFKKYSYEIDFQFDFLPYIYPLWVGIKKIEELSILTFEREEFEEAWDIIVHEVYQNRQMWGFVKAKALEEASTDSGMFYKMLEVAYAIAKEISIEDKVNKCKNDKIKEIDKLYADVQEYHSTENYKELVEFIAKFSELAPYNAMLVRMQKPGSEYVATAYEWKNKYGREPKTGARPLVVLKRFGPVSFVYELNDTEGDNLPENIEHPFKASGNASFILSQIIRNINKEGIDYMEVNNGSSLAGYITRVYNKQPFPFIPKTTRGKTRYAPHEYDIVINSNFNDAEKCATLFHELGHYFAGHMLISEGNKNVPERESEIQSLKVREFEAETICWLTCKRCGINTASEGYLYGYLEKNHTIPKGVSIDAILNACGKIEQMIDGNNKLRECIIRR